MSSLRRPRGVLLVSLVVTAMVAAALCHVYIHLQMIQIGYELGRERKTHHDLSEQNQKLRLELSTRSDPTQIERRAREELHMTPPDPLAIRVLHPPPSGPAGSA